MEKFKDLKPEVEVNNYINFFAKNDLHRYLLIMYAKDVRDCFLNADFSKVQKRDDLFQKARNENPHIDEHFRSIVESLIISAYENEAYTYSDVGYMMEVYNVRTWEIELMHSGGIYDLEGKRISKDFGEHYLSRNVYEGDIEVNERMYDKLKDKAKSQYTWFEESPAEREIKPFKESVNVKLGNGNIYMNGIPRDLYVQDSVKDLNLSEKDERLIKECYIESLHSMARKSELIEEKDEFLFPTVREWANNEFQLESQLTKRKNLRIKKETELERN
ncbi:hypothetical protein [Paenibacillus larvae]|uniref:Uncharacterized protein n=1 Tax=Paenibacillus larvae subsp. larvae TaxID=147375 RepID=A0A2L1U7F2_9BACL|nr:hypothetical protein [Paenibacillus larvae]AVF28845.1 hypothetical protein ERICIII_04841 [Paenibacillus larvae subsp. larvae]MCY9500305.1 hypothetical protein [Paenibacillus larvae]MCY9746947.1 hypothetical protein [Paenibacillus larvae]MCY9752441.1 hypothetical protein [Paenibacillus larvae]MDR5608741.1 hypothetical protein [Paenibacillus larvae]